MFFITLSEDSLQNERQKPQLVQERERGAGSECWAAAAAAAAARKGLILPPHTPGAKSGCLLCLDGGALCCKEPICGQCHVSPDGCLSNEACVRKGARDEVRIGVEHALCSSWTGTL